MNIKKMIKFSFLINIFLVMILASISSIVVIQIKENNQSFLQITKLVSLQSGMESLLKDVILTEDLSQIDFNKQNFTQYEEKFEQIKDKFMDEHDFDLLDVFIDDLDQDLKIKKYLTLLFDNEATIEQVFEQITTLQITKIQLLKNFKEHYPLENIIRKELEKIVLLQKDMGLLQVFSNIKYYSKETLYQHKNRKYLNKWLNEIDSLSQLLTDELYLSKLIKYKQVVNSLGETIIQINRIEKNEKKLEQGIFKLVQMNKEVNHKVAITVEELASSFINKIYSLISLLVIAIIGFIIALAYKLYNTIGLSVDEIEEKITDGLKEINKLNVEIEKTQKEVVFTMGAIGESRSKETGNHVKRVAEYSKMLALYYGLPEGEAEMLKQASPMHDIGKVAIPDAILNKPGRFDEDEFKVMKTHAELGYKMLNKSERALLKMASIVAYEHHEKWDGSGYPQGTSGEQIHLYGRITAIADVFDALGSDRVYKKAWTDEQIFKLFREEKGIHFEPKLIDLFFEHLSEFLSVRDKLKDNFN